MLRIASLATALFALTAVALITTLPACEVQRLDDDDDDDDGGEGEGDAGEGEGEGDGNCVLGPEDNDAACSDGCNNDPADDGAQAFIDCDDFDCQGTVPCRENICDDLLDNDGNTFTDCADFACDLDAACAEDCGNGLDDDADGRVDCADGACNGAAGDPPSPDCAAGEVEIQSIQDGTVGVGTTVSVSDVYVTTVSVAASGNVTLFLQTSDGETVAPHTYPEFAGIGVFVPSAVAPDFPVLANVAVGDCVDIAGSVSEFNGQTQIANVTALAAGDGCGTEPTPFLVTVAEIATTQGAEGPNAETYEGVLLRIENVTAVAASGEFGWDVDQGGAEIVFVSDFLLGNQAPVVAADQAFAAIQGVYNTFNDRYQLQPRNLADIEN